MALLATAILAGSGAPSHAAGPAVSAVNGKLEFDAGVLSLPASSFTVRGAGSLTLPLGHDFGFQGDITLGAGSGFGSSGAAHLFMRDPDTHLIGAAFGFARMPGSTVFAAGPEAELYYGRFSLEAWGGVAHTSYDNPATPDRTGAFIVGDLAYYPEDDWRLDAGLSLLSDHLSAHAGTEYLLHGMFQPVSLAFDARIGSDGSVGATAGFKVYLGGGDKSLIARHRQDDPQNRGSTLSDAAGRPGSAPAGTDGGGDDGGGDDDEYHYCPPDYAWNDKTQQCENVH